MLSRLFTGKTLSQSSVLSGVVSIVPVVPVVLVVTVPWTLALVVGRGYLAAAVFAVGHFLLLGYVDGKFEASSKMHLLGLPSALITLSIALGFDRIGTASGRPGSSSARSCSPWLRSASTPRRRRTRIATTTTRRRRRTFSHRDRRGPCSTRPRPSPTRPRASAANPATRPSPIVEFARRTCRHAR